MDIGLIGLGLMGRAMALRLVAAGHGVAGYDINEDARMQAAGIGVDVQETAADVARGTRLILLSLLTSDNRRELLWGAQALADALQPGTVILDTTTGKPEDIEEDSRRLATAGIKLTDVCLSGSSQVMQEGRAIALIGDNEKDADYNEVIEGLSKARYYFQKPGEGNRVKLIVNLVFGLNRLVLAEALGLAERAGFNLTTILEILKSGETYSVAMDTKGPKMIARVYEPAVARLGQHAKDVHLIMEYARQLGASVPVTETHAQIIDALVREGLGDLDNAAIFKAYHS
jgi:3-hydroxyisobutyrate dehydrogenase-like beta-hydroxyacid dehydrogenase